MLDSLEMFIIDLKEGTQKKLKKEGRIPRGRLYEIFKKQHPDCEVSRTKFFDKVREHFKEARSNDGRYFTGLSEIPYNIPSDIMQRHFQ